MKVMDFSEKSLTYSLWELQHLPEPRVRLWQQLKRKIRSAGNKVTPLSMFLADT